MIETVPHAPQEQAEQVHRPVVTELVGSSVPERRALTIDGITIPDFDIVQPKDMAQTIRYIMTPDTASPTGYTYDARLPSNSPQEPENLGTYKAWVAQAIGAVDDIPKGGRLGILMDLSYLAGPTVVQKLPAWHHDDDLGSLTIFEDEKYTTMVAKRESQDANAGRSQMPFDALIDSVQPAGSQTLYIAPEAWHSNPFIPAGTNRRGVICFIIALAETQVGDTQIYGRSTL